jgi:hypothetical protein
MLTDSFIALAYKNINFFKSASNISFGALLTTIFCSQNKKYWNRKILVFMLNIDTYKNG